MLRQWEYQRKAAKWRWGEVILKITFTEQAVKEAERQRADRNREVHAGVSAVEGQVPFAAFLGGQNDLPGAGGEKGKSLIELQQEAADADVGVQQNFMTVMSHTLSEEDYAKMQEEGFDPGSMEPEEVVTIVDKIKAELARAGKNIVGYTDNLDMGTLTAALGSEVLARSVADSFREADVPLTKENLSAISQAWAMSSGLQPMGDGSYSYLIDNGMEAEIWNLYLAQSSGAGRGGNAPRFYTEDVQGYYTQSAGREQTDALQGQIDRIIEQSGSEVNQRSRENAKWLLDRGLPLTPENLKRLKELEQVELPVTEKRFGEAVAAAVAEGKNPVHASLEGKSANLYEKAAAISEYYHSSELWEATVGDITARRQLEEVRLRMTAEVNVKLLKSGFSIDTAPMEELIEALKLAEHQLADQYFPRDDMAVEKYHNYRKVSTVTDQLPGLPADVLGIFAKGRGGASLETIYNEGKALQDNYEKAQASYEKLMTMPRSEMGDSIEKAFASVDHILKDLGVELTEENRRAVRILGYNRMEMNLPNLEAVREADRQVQDVLGKLTPAATLKMIRDGFNPLEKSFGELEQYFKSLPPEYKKEAESYSRFLYGLERNNAITPEERESYIGIYRLVRQFEKAEGAAVGALVNAQSEIQFSSLLAAMQGGRRSVDLRVSEDMGAIDRQKSKTASITEQISKAFVKTVADIRAEKAARAAAAMAEAKSIPSAETAQPAVEAAQAGENAVPDGVDAFAAQNAGTFTQERTDAENNVFSETKAEGTAENTAGAAEIIGGAASAVASAATDSGAADIPQDAAPVSEALLKAANEMLTEVSSDEETEREYNKAQLEEQRQAVSAADQESVAMLQRGELPASADNLMAAHALTHGRENIFALSDRRRTGEERQAEVQESGHEPVESTRLWEKLEDREDFAESYERMTEEALESVEEATFEEAESSVDVRNMQLNHKQLTVAASLAQREEYYLPMYVGETLTRIHLTLDRNSPQKGTVTIGVTLSEEAHMQARLYLENDTVHGILFGEGKVEVMKLQQIADTFRKEAEGSWTVGNISTIASEKRMPELIKSGAHTPTESADLYRVARVFLQSVVQQGE